MKPSFGPGLFPIGVMAALAGLTLWLSQTTQLPEPDRSGKFRHDPDYRIERFTLTKLSPQGEPHHVLVADKMLHYPDDDTTDVTRPRLTTLVPGKPRTLVTSDMGHVNSDGSEVQLTGNVHLVRDGTKGNPPMEAFAPDLLVLPDDEKASTKSPVRFVQGTSQLNGTGFDMDSAAMQANLHSRVTGQFESRHKK